MKLFIALILMAAVAFHGGYTLGTYVQGKANDHDLDVAIKVGRNTVYLWLNQHYPHQLPAGVYQKIKDDMAADR